MERQGTTEKEVYFGRVGPKIIEGVDVEIEWLSKSRIYLVTGLPSTTPQKKPSKTKQNKSIF